MKRIKHYALIAVAAAFLTAGLSACEDDASGDCAYCKQVVKDGDGNIVNENYVGEFCLEELEEKMDAEPITDPSGMTTEWVCN